MYTRTHHSMHDCIVVTTSRLVFYDLAPCSFLSNQSLQGYKCTYSPLDIHLIRDWEINIWSCNQLPHQARRRPRRRVSVWFIIKETTTSFPCLNHIPIPKLIRCACPGSVFITEKVYLKQVPIIVVSDLSCLPCPKQVIKVVPTKTQPKHYHSVRLCAPSYFELVARHLDDHIPRPWWILLLSHCHCGGGRHKYLTNCFKCSCVVRCHWVADFSVVGTNFCTFSFAP